MDKGFNQIFYELDEETEEELLVTTGSCFVNDEEEDDEFEVYFARINVDGETRGVINYKSMETALERTQELLEGEKTETLNTRHIEALKATIDEVGLDRAIELLERIRDNK